ncbi:MAG TPA: DUF1573 domain-containing protein [Bacteroidia bacterium]|jgi:hypothetical protein|nr:DUF1573 domain-containing protein [Bacteroidia bacterium]
MFRFLYKILPLLAILNCCAHIVFAQPVITFEKSTQHLGFVHQGDTLHFNYAFTNTGNQPLVITDTKVECSCTSAEKPTQPIDPGKQGVIKASFNTTPTIDRQDRTITIISNASNSPSVVRFKCVVLKAKKKKE